MKRIYLDHAASTPVDPEVLGAMEPYFTRQFGNPGSLHSFGQESIAAMDRSRETVARLLGTGFRNVIFTGSATEANNLALRGAVKKLGASQKTQVRVIVSSVEHESVLETARDLAKSGAEAVFAPVDMHGRIDLKNIKENLTEKTAIVSVMYAQNEIGSVQPIVEIGKAIRAFRGAKPYPLFHTDAAQAFQFLDCSADELGVDLMTLSSHKIYGPKGIGALYVRDEIMIAPTMTGGGQEFGLRSGTENVPLAVGFAKAAELAAAVRAREAQRVGELRDRLWKGLKDIFPKVELNGPADAALRLPNILNVCFPAHDAQDLLTKFDLGGLAVSAGSACRSRAAGASYVIEALGLGRDRARSSIRFSLGRPTGKEEIDGALRVITKLFSR
jgi:cysteine desulfurase